MLSDYAEAFAFIAGNFVAVNEFCSLELMLKRNAISPALHIAGSLGRHWMQNRTKCNLARFGNGIFFYNRTVHIKNKEESNCQTQNNQKYLKNKQPVYVCFVFLHFVSNMQSMRSSINNFSFLSFSQALLFC